MDNARRRGVRQEQLDEIVRLHGITAASFAVLERMDAVEDGGGQSYFLLPPGIGAPDARAAVLMTYVYNAGTDYGRPGVAADFPPTPYGADEVARIVERQRANWWSYEQDIRLVDRSGGRLVSTPNGMLMGVFGRRRGNRMVRVLSQRAGTAWGDIFMVNLGCRADPADLLRAIIASRHAWCADRAGRPVETTLDLDRVLHHEELHSQQWAAKGYLGMVGDYGRELVREAVLRRTNRLEADAGLSDGGYR